MRRSLLIPIIAAIVLALIVGTIIFFPHLSTLFRKQTVTQEKIVVAPLTQKYTNNAFRFTFNYPENYVVREVANTDGTSILIESKDTGKGVQIYVTPYKDADTTITPERVEEEVGDMIVEDSQPIVLSAGGGEGLAFKSDNPDFEGDSREAWFVVAGHLYQISTYAEYDEFLKAIFATWTFF